MADLLDFVDKHPILFLTALAVLAVIVLVALTMSVIAFREGRNVSFWPPRVGPRPSAASELRSQQEADKAAPSTIRRRYGQHISNDPAIAVSGIPDTSAQQPLSNRRLYLKTPNAIIESAKLGFDTKCIVKSTSKHLVDADALRMLVNRDISEFCQRTSMSVLTPAKIWTENGKICELYPFHQGVTLDWLIGRNKYRLRGSYLGVVYNCALGALAKLHRLGILHRDVGPDNMMLTSTGDIILLDPSFACGAGTRQIPVVNPRFSAPEQGDGRATAKSDIYSLAATMYFLANGREPRSVRSDEFQDGIMNVNFGAFGNPIISGEDYDEAKRHGYAHLVLMAKMLSEDIKQRPDRYSEMFLRPGTYPRGEELFGVFDVGPLGRLVLYPSGIFIGSEDEVRNELGDFVKRVGLERVGDEGLCADVRAFLDGDDPWPAD